MAVYNSYPMTMGRNSFNNNVYPAYNRGFMNTNNFMANPANQQYVMQQTDGYMQQANNLYNSSLSGYQPSPAPQVFCQMVTSEDEAKAALINTDGSLYIFIDLPHNTIYTKQLELDGTAPLRTFTQINGNNSQSQEKTQVVGVENTPTSESISRTDIDIEKFATKEDIDQVFDYLNDLDKQLVNFKESLDILAKDIKKKSNTSSEDKQ